MNIRSIALAFGLATSTIAAPMIMHSTVALAGHSYSDPYIKKLSTRLGIAVGPLRGGSGFIVTEILDPNGIAAKAGVTVGDQIKTANGKALRTPQDLIDVIKAARWMHIARIELIVKHLHTGKFSKITVDL